MSLKNTIKVGMKVTCREREEAYYSRYAGQPECFFEPGDVGVVGAIKVPSVWRENIDFVCVDFEKNGRSWRCGLLYSNIVQVKTKPNRDDVQEMTKKTNPLQEMTKNDMHCVLINKEGWAVNELAVRVSVFGNEELIEPVLISRVKVNQEGATILETKSVESGCKNTEQFTDSGFLVGKPTFFPPFVWIRKPKEGETLEELIAAMNSRREEAEKIKREAERKRKLDIDSWWAEIGSGVWDKRKDVNIVTDQTWQIRLEIGKGIIHNILLTLNGSVGLLVAGICEKTVGDYKVNKHSYSFNLTQSGASIKENLFDLWMALSKGVSEKF